MEYESDAFTTQYCRICHKRIVIDALDFLMNLDDKNIMVCEECKNKRKKEGVI